MSVRRSKDSVITKSLTSLQHSNLGGDSSTGKEIVSQSDEVDAVLFYILATDILQSLVSCKSHG
jgi:hypothetical protein